MSLGPLRCLGKLLGIETIDVDLRSQCQWLETFAEPFCSQSKLKPKPMVTWQVSRVGAG